jgi:hypothetical protein
VSTPSERLEAEIWLDSTGPDLSTRQREAFFAAVNEYYQAYPTADRGTDILTTLREDDHAFALILNEIQTDDSEAAAASAAVAAVRR